ncbi:Adenylate cyclase type 1 [Acipenser ruthenus]|uniref:Adenylate cyclase type 1 n=1 Tax=Acipenser ruthenus TaxID=7906 RepID=A0A444U254_ACIRT|nr:Adenylate cyclase type 1 [Acipenser ruthenus]
MNGTDMEEIPFQKVKTRRKKGHCPPGSPLNAIACEDEFDCKELESLFQNYNLKLEQTSTLKALAVLIIMTSTLALVELMSGPSLTISKGSHPVHCIIFVSLFIVTNVKYLQVTQLQQIVKLTLLFSFTFSFLCCPFSLGAYGLEPPTSPEQGMWQLMLVTFVAYSLLPVRTLLATVFGLMVSVSHIIVSATSVTAKRQPLWRTLVANAVLFASVNLSGVFVRILTERTQRKAFLQARNCIEDRLRLEDENEKQERLLMSLLPRNVAMEMKEDFLKPPERIFHKIYIQRHDNVRWGRLWEKGVDTGRHQNLPRGIFQKLPRGSFLKAVADCWKTGCQPRSDSSLSPARSLPCLGDGTWRSGSGTAQSSMIQFWLAEMQDPGLGSPYKVGATLNLAGRTLCVGQNQLRLTPGQEKEQMSCHTEATSWSQRKKRAHWTWRGRPQPLP